jgi:hypothetical protein
MNALFYNKLWPKSGVAVYSLRELLFDRGALSLFGFLEGSFVHVWQRRSVMNRKTVWWKALEVLVVFLGGVGLMAGEQAGSSLSAQAFLLEAEEGQTVSGKVLRQGHPEAHGGAYVEAVSEEGARVRYRFSFPRPGQYRVIPIFWRNSAKMPPRFFPFPAPRAFGPDAVAALENRFFFTAPAGGQIGSVDLEGNLVGSIQVGGYVTDLVVDAARKRLLVVDAAAGRIVVLEPGGQEPVLQRQLPGIWRLAMGRGRWGLGEEREVLFAASRAGRRLYLLNPETLEPLQEYSLPAGAVHMALSGGAEPQLQIGLEPVAPVVLEITGLAPAEVPARYRAVFYAEEPVRLKLNLHLLESGMAFQGELAVHVFNYMDEHIWSNRWEEYLGGQQRRSERILELPLSQTGVYRLEAEFRSSAGKAEKTFYFLRMPRLERPRLLARPAQWAEAKKIMAKYPHLFQRYFQWLVEQMQTPGFLPTSLLRAEFLPSLPPEQKKLANQGGWRRYDLAYRLLGVELACHLLPEPDRNPFQQSLLQVLRSGRSDSYCHFHHHGPFFPGFDAAFLDLAAAELGEQTEPVQKLREFLAGRLGDMNVLAWTLAAMGDPPTPRERMLLWELMTWRVNAERYFTVHAGKRGGTWWLNHRTGCHCPFAGYAYGFLYLRHFFGEERLHERTFIRGFVTHARLTRPRQDVRGIFGPESPPGEPQRWITHVLSRHPLTETIYNWRPILDRLQQPEPPSKEELARCFFFPDSANNNLPVPFVLPLGLALGWYDPQMPQVGWEEMPPTVLFDGEGEVVMRSDYSPQATEVFFACGIRDHVYRHQPTHLMVMKAGEPLLSTASFWGDHGCPSLAISEGNSWGNVVVVEPSDWQTRWKNNFFHPRGEELALINRFTNATFRRLVREQRLAGYLPAESGFGGGLNLHGHTETFLHREGRILAFETHPAFDYVAGDGTLSWLPEQARRVVRQVLFVRPDLVLVYDRVRLGPKAERAYWLAATGLNLQTNANRFIVQSGEAFLNGLVLAPVQARLVAVDPAKSEKYRSLFDKRALNLKVLEIHPPSLPSAESSSQGVIEFLTAMRIGLGSSPAIAGSLELTDKQMHVAIQAEDRTVEAAFERGDLCTGQLWIRAGKVPPEAKAPAPTVITYRFTEQVHDGYELWNKDPRYPLWYHDPRFRFLAVGHEKPE